MKQIRQWYVTAICATALALPGVADAFVSWDAGIVAAKVSSGLEDTKIVTIVRAVMLWFLGLVGVLGVVAFVIAGVLYLTAAGDEDQLRRAKKHVFYGLIGVLLALSGVVVIRAVTGALNAETTF